MTVGPAFQPSDPASRPSAKRAANNAADAFGDAADVAERASNHPWFEKAARAGHIANGILHFVIGLIALNLAFGSAPADADQSGAIALMAATPFGAVLIALCALGAGLLGLWHLSEAIWDRDSAKDGLRDAGKAVAYLFIGGVFAIAAFGGQPDSGESTSSISAALMRNPFGAVLLVIVGAVIIVIGGYHVYSGITRKFEENLRSSSERRISQSLRVTGTIGYIAKGVVLALIGLLFIVATVKQDPEDSTGMDGALRALLDQPYGNVLLAVVGLGLMIFGVFAFMRSRYAKVS